MGHLKLNVLSDMCMIACVRHNATELALMDAALLTHFSHRMKTFHTKSFGNCQTVSSKGRKTHDNNKVSNFYIYY